MCASLSRLLKLSNKIATIVHFTTKLFIKSSKIYVNDQTFDTDAFCMSATKRELVQTFQQSKGGFSLFQSWLNLWEGFSWPALYNFWKISPTREDFADLLYKNFGRFHWPVRIFLTYFQKCLEDFTDLWGISWPALQNV